MIFINGQFLSADQVAIAHNDRGLLLSDGVFETLRAYSGHVFCLREHWERLQEGLKYLEMPFPYSFDEFSRVFQEILRLNGLTDKDASLRLTVTRGVGPRGLLPPKEPKPTIMLVAYELPAHATAPANLIVSSIRRNERSPLCNIKSLSYLDNVLARREAVKKGADEAILLNTQDFVAEASAANVFIINKEGTVITPRLEDGALPGITRRVILNLCKELGLKAEERQITLRELDAACEIFLTNALIEIQPVKTLNQRFVNEGAVGVVTLRLQEAYYYKIKLSKKNIIDDKEKVPDDEKTELRANLICRL